MFKALIFDMDGLMIDSERLYFQTEREIARKFQKNVSNETLGRMMGRKPIESMKLFVEELGLPLSPEEVLETRTRIMHEKMKTELMAMPGLHHILDAFYGRLKLAVCTAAQEEFLDIALDRLNIREKFSALQTSDGIQKGKPDPEIYLAACEKLGLKPQECVVLEDSSNGALAGKRAGSYVIAVPSEYTRGQDFSFADFVAADLFQAEKHIQTLLGRKP